jgi:hypothetical protein
LRHELANIKEDKSLEEGWPSEADVQELVKKAGRLFIYAATACRFLSKSRCPKKHLSEMLQVDSAGHSSTKELDEMYKTILKNLIIDQDEDNDDVAGLFIQIVGSIVMLFDSLSAPALTKLLAVLPDEMNATLEPLRSVLNVPEDKTSPIQLFHLSFRDFLVDKNRCPDPQFWINEKTAHKNLFLSCLKLMSDHLRRDMCDLRLPGALATEVEKSKVEKCLPLEVQYACRYWIGHLLQGNIELCDSEEVHEFLKEHFLHWLEALSLIWKIPEGIHSVIELFEHLSTLPVSDTVLPYHYLQR